MDFPALSPDINPIENLWAEISRKLYAKGVVYSNRNGLIASINATFSNFKENKKEYLRKLAKSVEKRCLDVIQNNGAKINY